MRARVDDQQEFEKTGLTNAKVNLVREDSPDRVGEPRRTGAGRLPVLSDLLAAEVAGGTRIDKDFSIILF